MFDPVGAWSVHGTCSVWGTLVLSLFNMDTGRFTGHGFTWLGIQVAGAPVFVVFSVVTSWIA